MCAPEGNSEFCFPESLNVSRESQCFPRVSMFPESLNVSRDEVEGNIETRGKKNQQHLYDNCILYFTIS